MSTMIEASENIDLVTLRRQNDLEASRRATADLLARAAQPAPAALAMPEQQSAPAAGTAAVALQDPQPPPPAEDGMPMAGRVRLGVTAGLVVLLVAAWFWQRRAASGR